MRRLTSGILFLVLGAYGAGCARFPHVGDPQSYAASGEPLPLRAYLAPFEVEVLPSEKLKEYDLERVLNPRLLGTETLAWLEASGVFTHVDSGQGEDRGAALDEASRRGDDVLLEIALRQVNTLYDGHNSWWVPNVVLWWLVMVPAWFVATEEYSLSLTVDLRVRSVDSGRILHQHSQPARVEGTLGEFQRGFQFFGFLWPSNEASNWQAVAESLAAGARGEVGARVCRELDTGFRESAKAADFRDRMRKTVAVVVGVSLYEDSLNLPPLLYAASDARAVARALQESLGVQARHLSLLLDRQATREALESKLGELASQIREGDRLVVYFSGYGSRGDGGGAQILLSEADKTGLGRLDLEVLAQLLDRIPGERLVLLDTGFDGFGRSVAGGTRPLEERVSDLAALAQGGAAMVAVSPGDQLVAPEAAGGSLFALHLLRGLRGDADREQDGLVSPGELYSLLSEHVVGDAAHLGQRQRPLARGLEHPCVLRLATSLERAQSGP